MNRQSTVRLLLGRAAPHAIIAGIMASVLSVSPALAQDAATSAESDAETHASGAGIADIVVTARRISESLQRVPVAITAVSQENLERNSVTKIEDLPRLTPGFTAQQSFQSDTPIYSIRGQSGDQNASANTEPAVQVYFAELNQARSIGTGGSFFDLESVQVLKGPQGTLFGRNSTGGAILVTPRAPDMGEFGGYGRVSIGDYGLHDFEGMLNLPLGDTVALRVGGKTVNRKGYIRNLATGDRAGEIDSESVRASMRVEPSSTFSSTFIATFFHSYADGNYVKLDSVNPDFIRAAFADFGPLTELLVDAYEGDAAAQRALRPLQTRATTPVWSRNKVHSIQNNSELRIDDNLRLKSIVGYRDARQDQATDFYGGALANQFGETIDSRSKLFSAEVQLQGEYGPLSFVLGAYYLNEDVDFDAATAIFQPVLTTLGPIIPGLEFGLPARDLVSNKYSTRSRSLFVHADYKFTDKLTLSGGIRMTRDRKSADISYLDASGNPAGIAGYSCVLSGEYYPTTPDFASCNVPIKLKSTEPTYDASLSYQASDDVLVYIAHRHGYRAGGFDVIPGNLSRLSFLPEQVNDVELGFKAKFDMGDVPIRFNAAVYHQWYKDIQRLINVPSPTGGPANATANAGSAKVYGGEAELTIRPIRQLELSATYAYIHNRYSKFDVPYNSPLGGPEIPLDVSDSRFAGVPQHQWSVGGRFALPVAETLGEVALTANLYGQTSSPANEINTANCGPDGLNLTCLSRFARVPGRTLLDLRLDWNDISGSGVDLGLFMTNVTDKKYKATVLGLNGALGFTSVGYGPPRMFGAVLRVPFGSEANR